MDYGKNKGGGGECSNEAVGSVSKGIELISADLSSGLWSMDTSPGLSSCGRVWWRKLSADHVRIHMSLPRNCLSPPLHVTKGYIHPPVDCFIPSELHEKCISCLSSGEILLGKVEPWDFTAQGSGKPAIALVDRLFSGHRSLLLCAFCINLFCLLRGCLDLS